LLVSQVPSPNSLQLRQFDAQGRHEPLIEVNPIAQVKQKCSDDEQFRQFESIH